MNAAAAPLLEVTGLVKRYGGVVAIDHVDLQLWAGTITGVIGPNGAGKSTLIGMIGGAVTPSAGHIRLGGRDISRLPASERARAGIGRTYQIPRPFLDMTVAENLEVAQYSMAPLIGAGPARSARIELLQLTGLLDVAGVPARALPLLKRKRLEVARALALKPRVLLLDEVGAGLIDSEITELITLIQAVADASVAIIIVEHVLRVVRACCARSMVLNFGKKLIEGPTAEILAHDEVASVYLGTGGARQSAPAAPKDEAAPPPRDPGSLSQLIAPRSSAASRPPLLELQGICAGYGQARVLKGIDLQVHEGEAIAILGANGAGKTTLARTITGAINPTAGTLRIAGNDAAGRPAHDIAGLGIAHCMEGRRIFPTLSVRDNLLVAARRVDRATAQQRLAAVYELFPILAERAAQGGTSLSGGQQQMLAIGRALMARPRLVIFDEVSLGLAPIIMDRLYEALATLKAAGMTLVIIEQDVDRALALADKVYVLEHGIFGLAGDPRDIADDPRLRHIYIGTAD
ncbi:MAG: ATP-binding cassette domain-containing protein [Hyphomicrobiales bacterium]|nr:ATP-binding cassette domain-containing protein [Hyphomicrobiales bacterium]